MFPIGMVRSTTVRSWMLSFLAATRSGVSIIMPSGAAVNDGWVGCSAWQVMQRRSKMALTSTRRAPHLPSPRSPKRGRDPQASGEGQADHGEHRRRKNPLILGALLVQIEPVASHGADH